MKKNENEGGHYGNIALIHGWADTERGPWTVDSRIYRRQSTVYDPRSCCLYLGRTSARPCY